MYLVQEAKVASDNVFIKASKEPIIRFLNVEVLKDCFKCCEVSFKVVKSLLCN